jgi:hypothetical protein
LGLVLNRLIRTALRGVFWSAYSSGPRSSTHAGISSGARQRERPAEAEAAFFPEAKNNVFAEITLKSESGFSCGLLEGTTYLVKAAGPEVKEPAVDRKCGFLAQVGKDNGGTPPVFARTGSGALYESGALNFPVPAAESAVVWQEKAKTFQKVSCSLQSGLGEAGHMYGFAMVDTEPTEPYGWEM